MDKAINKSQMHIDSLTGIKAIAMLLLFWWHSGIPSPKTDLGARTCELLFVASGFLVGYNYYFKEMPATWRASVEYSLKKVIKFWPLHMLMLLWMISGVLISGQVFDGREAIRALLNALLLQSWSPYSYMFFSFNGASWFLSSLIFCYFMTPMLLRLSKKLKGSVILFFVIVALRYLLENITVHNPNTYFDFFVHTSPVIRCFEFFAGMLMVPMFFKLKDTKLTDNFWICTFVEVVTMAMVIALAIYKNDTWLRGKFVAVFTILVFVFAYDGGLVSKLLSIQPFKWFGKIQFEFFIIHQAFMFRMTDTYLKLFKDWKLVNIAIFISILVCAIIYKIWLSKPLSRLTQQVIRGTAQSLGFEINV